MPRRFQVTLHGTGFSVRVEGGDPVRGFYAIRRVLAEDPEEAERQAIAALQGEEKFQWMLECTERVSGSRSGCSVRRDNISEMSWLSWHFSKEHKNFVFYTDDDDA